MPTATTRAWRDTRRASCCSTSTFLAERPPGAQAAPRARDERLPVIMITGTSDEAAITTALVRGAFAYVPKPFNIEYAVEAATEAPSHSDRLQGRQRASCCRPARPLPDMTPEVGMACVFQPNVVMRDQKAGVQVGELILVTERGFERMRTAVCSASSDGIHPRRARSARGRTRWL